MTSDTARLRGEGTALTSSTGILGMLCGEAYTREGGTGMDELGLQYICAFAGGCRHQHLSVVYRVHHVLSV